MNWAAAGAVLGLVLGVAGLAAGLAMLALWLDDRFESDYVAPVVVLLGVALIGALFVGAML